MFTSTQIKQMKYDGRSQDFRPVPELPRLGVRIYPSGRKMWALRYRLEGDRKLRLLTLASCALRKPSEVLLEAREILLAIDKGENPKALRRRVTKKYTLREFADHYLSLLKRDGKSERAYGDTKRRLKKKIFPALGAETFLLHVVRDDVTGMHTKLTNNSGPVEANRCVQLLRTMFNKAEKSLYLPDGTPNPCSGVDLNTEKSRTRYLKSDELERLGDALKHEAPDTQAKVHLILHLGLRKSEILSLRWADVQLEDSDDFKAHINLANTKSGRDHRLGLNKETKEIFAQLHKIRLVQKVRRAKRNKRTTRGLAISPYVFPSKYDLNDHVKDFKQPWHRIRKRAGLEDVTLHDLRRTCGTILAQSDVPLEVISQILNHTNPEVTRIYAKLSSKQMTQALDKVSEAVSEKVGRVGGRNIA